MKQLFTVFFLLFFIPMLKAQNVVLDKEKLLDLYQTQRYAEAASYLQSIYPSDTQDVKALSQIAYCYMMSGKLPDAEKKYLKINELQPNTLSVLFSLANINSRRGNVAAAQFYLLDIIKIDGIVTNKSFIDTRTLLNYQIPDYDLMILDMITDIHNFPDLYSHYTLKLRNINEI